MFPTVYSDLIIVMLSSNVMTIVILLKSPVKNTQFTEALFLVSKR